MRIGLCLKYEARNYGSKLQALATIRVIEELGHECKVIHYGKAGLWFKIKSLPRIFNPIFRQDKLLELSKKNALRAHPELVPLLKVRNDLFKQYDIKYFDKYEVRGEYFKDIQQLALQFDAIVSCSDQLWSPAGWGTNFYNLMFVPDTIRKVSFASSFGISQIPNGQKKGTAEYIKRIEHVSCRENRGAEIVKELTGRDVPVLMDPVFAYDKEEWSKLVEDEQVYDFPYIFCYFLGTNIEHRKVADAFAKKHGLKIVFLRYLDQYVDYDKNFGDYAPYDVDPSRFMNILRHAKYVFTDSFHGCAFSIINHKEFVVFDRYANTSSVSKNSRIDSVCKNLDLSDRRFDGTNKLNEIVDRPIDWVSIQKKLNSYKEKMRDFLNTALKA